MNKIKATLLFTITLLAASLFVSCSNLFEPSATGSGTLTIAMNLDTSSVPGAAASSRCIYPTVTDNITYSYELYKKDEQEASITGTIESLIDGKFTISNIPYGTYSKFVVTGQTSKEESLISVLTGSYTSAFTIGSGSTTQTIPLTLSTPTTIEASTTGIVTLGVTLTSPTNLNITSTSCHFTATFTPTTTTGEPYEYKSTDAGETFTAKKSNNTTDTAYVYTLAIANTSLVSGTYSLSVSYTDGSSETQLLSGEDTSLVVMPYITTNLTYNVAINYDNIYVDSTKTDDGTGTLNAPYKSLQSAFDSLATFSKPVQINLLADYSAEATDSLLSCSVPLIINCHGHNITSTGTSALISLIDRDTSQSVTLMNGSLSNTSEEGTSSIIQVKGDLKLENFTLSCNILSEDTSTMMTIDGNLYLINSSVTYNNKSDASHLIVGLSPDYKIYMSETTPSSTYISGGILTLFEEQQIYLQSKLTRETVATIELDDNAQPVLNASSAPFDDNCAADLISTTQWPLAQKGMFSWKDKTVVLNPLGFLYRLYNDDSKYKYEYMNLTATTTSLTSTADSTNPTENDSIQYMDAAFDANGMMYLLYGSNIGEETQHIYLSVENTCFTLPSTSLSLSLKNSTAGSTTETPFFSIAADSTHNIVFIATNKYDSDKGSNTSTLYSVSGYSGVKSFFPETLELTAIEVGTLLSDPICYVTKIAYDPTNSLLFVATSDGNISKYKLTVAGSEATLETATDSTTTTTISPIVTAGLTEITEASYVLLSITDMTVMGGKLYILGAQVNSILNNDSNNVSRGVVIAINPLYELKEGSIQYSDMTVTGLLPNNMAQSNTDGDTTITNYTPTSTNEKIYLYGPRRILAVDSKKLVIGDDGFSFSYTDKIVNKRKRAVIYTIGDSLTFSTSIDTLKNTFSGNDYLYSLSLDIETASLPGVYTVQTNVKD